MMEIRRLTKIAVKKPLMLYDGDCGFCKRWIDYWHRLTQTYVDYAPSQERGGEFPEIEKNIFDQSVVLVLPNRGIYTGAHAVFLCLAQNPTLNWAGIVLRFYQRFRWFARLCEGAYRIVANHRLFFSRFSP